MADEPKKSSSDETGGKREGVLRKAARAIGDVKFTNPLTGTTTNLTQKLFDLGGAAKNKMKKFFGSIGVTTGNPLQTTTIKGLGVVAETKDVILSLDSVLIKTFINFARARVGVDLLQNNDGSRISEADASGLKQGALSREELKKRDKALVKAFQDTSTHETNLDVLPNFTKNGMGRDEFISMSRKCPVLLVGTDKAKFYKSRLAKMEWNGGEKPIRFLIIYTCTTESMTDERLEEIEKICALTGKFPGASSDNLVSEALTDDERRAIKSINDREAREQENKRGRFNHLKRAEQTTIELLESLQKEFPYTMFIVDDGKLNTFDDNMEKEMQAAIAGIEGKPKELEKDANDTEKEQYKKDLEKYNSAKKNVNDKWAAKAEELFSNFNQTGNITTPILDVQKMSEDLSGRMFRGQADTSVKDAVRNVKSADDFKLGFVFSEISQNGGPKIGSKEAWDNDNKKKNARLDANEFKEADDTSMDALEGEWRNDFEIYTFSKDKGNPFGSKSGGSGEVGLEKIRKGTITNSSSEVEFSWMADGELMYILTKNGKYCRKYRLDTKDAKQSLVFLDKDGNPLKDKNGDPLDEYVKVDAAKDNIMDKIKSFSGPWTITGSDGRKEKYTFEPDGLRIETVVAESIVEEGVEEIVEEDESSAAQLHKYKDVEKKDETTFQITLKDETKPIEVKTNDDGSQIETINGNPAESKAQEDAKKEFGEKFNGKRWYSNDTDKVYTFSKDSVNIQDKKDMKNPDKPGDTKQFKVIKKDDDGVFYVQIGDEKASKIKLIGADQVEMNGGEMTPYDDGEKPSVDKNLFKGQTKTTGKKNKKGLPQGTWTSADGKTRCTFTQKSDGRIIQTVTVDEKPTGRYKVISTSDGKLKRIPVDADNKEQGEEAEVDYSIADGKLSIGDLKDLQESLDIVEPTSFGRRPAIIIESVEEERPKAKKHYLEVEEPCQ